MGFFSQADWDFFSWDPGNPTKKPPLEVKDKFNVSQIAAKVHILADFRKAVSR